MKAIILLFDSLNKTICRPMVILQRKRLIQRPAPCRHLDNSYVGSMPWYAGNCTPGAITFCTVSGGRWNP